MATYHSFDDAEVQAILAAAAEHHDHEALMAAAPGEAILHASSMKLGDTCISVDVEDGKVCLNLPIVNKKVCLPIPKFIPNGTAAKACLKVCFTWAVPTGVCVTVTALGKTVAQQCFGVC